MEPPAASVAARSHDRSAEAIRRLVAWLEAQPDVAAAWLFGSRARGDARPESDIDLAVLPAAGGAEDPLRRRLRWGLAASRAAGLAEAELDLVTLDTAPILLAFAVAREGRLLVDHDPVARTAFLETTLHRAQDALHLRRIASEARAFRHGLRA